MMCQLEEQGRIESINLTPSIRKVRIVATGWVTDPTRHFVANREYQESMRGWPKVLGLEYFEDMMAVRGWRFEDQPRIHRKHVRPVPHYVEYIRDEAISRARVKI